MFTGKAEVTAYIHTIIKNFRNIQFDSPQFTVSADGQTVFFEGQGQLLVADGNKPYTNVYVFKFVVRDGLLIHITEYANPVTYCRAFGIPLG